MKMIISDENASISEVWQIYLFIIVPIISACIVAYSKDISKIPGCLMFIPILVFEVMPIGEEGGVSLSTGGFFYILLAVAMTVITYVEPKDE